MLALLKTEAQAFCDQWLGEGVVVMEPEKAAGDVAAKAIAQRHSDDDDGAGASLGEDMTVRTTATRATRGLPGRPIGLHEARAVSPRAPDRRWDCVLPVA
jgi:hypothetical protein